MSTKQPLTEPFGEALRSASMHQAVQACEYRVRYDDEFQSDVVVVVLILDFDEWNEEASEACAQSSDAVWEALAGLDVMVETICRTKAEHDAARGEDGSWRRINPNVSC